MNFARQTPPTVYQRGLWRRLLRSYLLPGSTASALRLQHPLGAWIAESNMKWGAMTWEDTLYRRDPHMESGERSVALHFPQQFDHADTKIEPQSFYDSTPDWYTATIPRLASPTDITGDQIYLTTYSESRQPSIPAAAATFAVGYHNCLWQNIVSSPLSSTLSATLKKSSLSICNLIVHFSLAPMVENDIIAARSPGSSVLLSANNSFSILDPSTVGIAASHLSAARRRH